MSSPATVPTCRKCNRTCYVKGCRTCKVCREAHLEYKRRKKAYYRTLAASSGTTSGVPRLQSAVKGITHGLPTTYEWYQCRCDACTQAVREDWQRSKALSRNRA